MMHSSNGNHRNHGFIIPLLNYAALAIAQAHLPDPAVNLGDTSFLDRVAGPGIVVEEIGDGAHNSETVGAKGHQVPGTGQVNTISSLTHIARLSRYRVMGDWYRAEVVVAAAHVNAGPQFDGRCIGDMTISPLILQWNEKKLGTVAFDQRVVFDFDLAVGEYSQNANLSLRRKVEMKNSIRISSSLLIALLFAMSAFAQSSLRRIEIHAHRFSFIPAEITVEKGKPVTLALTSDDVPHSLLIEGLHINAMMTKDHVTEVKLTPDMVGDFKGKCGRYCGSGHSSMVFTIHVGAAEQ